MNVHFISSLRRQIVLHKKLAVGSACLVVTTALWAATDLPRTARNNQPEFSTPVPAPERVDLTSRSTDSATIDDALQFGRQSLTTLKSITDYTATFTKSELLDGEVVTQTMDIKCRQQPFSVYLGTHRRGGKGREVIYVAGANDDNILVHEAGMKSVIGTLRIKPDSPKVMACNRHPMTDVGLVRLVELAMGLWEIDKREGNSADVEVLFFHDVPAANTVCDEVQIIHRRKSPGTTYQIGRVYVDHQTGLPVQGELYGWPNHPGDDAPLLEEYIYTNIKTNVGLTDQDFDPENSEYHFVRR